MKKCFIIAVLVLHALLQASANTPALVKQGVCYSCPDAREVYIVWGINKWQQPQRDLWPHGTFTRGGLLYTPMHAAKGVFTRQFTLPHGTQLDYVFWITKGPQRVTCDVWDVNSPQKDYHSLAVNDNTTLVSGQVQVSSDEQLSVVHYGRSWAAMCIMAGLFFFLVKKNKYSHLLLKPGSTRIIMCTGASLLVVLFAARISAYGLGWKMYHDAGHTAPQALWAGFYDYLYVLVLTIFFCLLAFVCQRRVALRRIITGVYISIAFLSAVAALLNIQVLEKLGKPFNMRWLYYSDFLNSADARTALTFNLAPSYLLNLLLVIAGAIILASIFIYAIEMLLLLQRSRTKRLCFASLALVNIAYVAFAQPHLPAAEYDKLANPVVAFAESLYAGEGHPKLYTMEVPDSLRPRRPARHEVKLPAATAGKIKNVLMIVLESTPTEYVQPYDQKYKITPALARYAESAIIFKNMYAHAPATNKSLVSLLASVYPWLSYNSITNEFPRIPIPTLSAELKKRGYRTAFFNSGDNRFQKTGEFLSYRGFDLVKDCRGINCAQYYAEENKDWGPLDGVNDACTARDLRTWISEQRSKNFFAMMWTYQTHYPYYASGERRDIEAHDSTLNRYLNAVHQTDRVLQHVIEGLKEDGLFDSTLIVVVGDHGEAFGRHGQTTHASMVYEENVHVPCLFINPAFGGEWNEHIGGLSDIAPSILSLLGIDAPPAWQGTSLFATGVTRRAYFFCPWSDYLYGYREGDKKYVYNATTDVTEIYDLKKDPFEQNNIATEHEINLCHQKLAGWAQFQDEYMKKIIPLR